ncbi:MAG: hypothetical protein K2K91_10620 [Ruminococcus sp.]|nr:hypothetical protein [Ruminococcus sp.]MDE7098749.1 hypothetical protein [Ruminococcus sp.]
MSDFYERKFMPNVKHIIAYVLILLSAVLFISGVYRAFRVTGRLSMEGLVFETEVHKGDSILLSSKPFKARLKETEHTQDVVWKTVLKGIMTDYDFFIVHVAYAYRPVMVKKGTEEYDKFLNGEEVTGYFTEKNFDDFPQFVSDMNSVYELNKEITDKNYSTLGIVIVNRQKELLSFLWGVPFLVISIILLKISGTPFIYTKIADDKE